LTVMIYGVVLVISAVALIPHLGVFLTSIANRWFLTVLPTEFTFRFYREVFSHDLTLSSIRTSLLLCCLSTLVDIILGVTIVYLLARKRLPGRDVLDTLAMLPLALPGLVLAFGYLSAFSATPLEARINPVPLSVVAYSVRRLPCIVRAAYAAVQHS